METLPLSLVIITLNEELNIERCIRSVPFAGEVLVMDSGSTDKTREICEKFSVNFVQNPWLGFGRQKNLAVSKSKFPWVICLEADEVLSNELQAEILRSFSTLNPEAGYAFPRRSWYLNRWIDHGGWYPDYQVRLFNREHSQWDPKTIHEKVLSNSTERFTSDLHHYVFRSISHQVITNDRYSSLQAKMLTETGQKFSWFKAVTKPWVKFMENYFWKQGFRDGAPGFIIAVGSAYSVFLKWVKIWELKKK
ncbi:MAG: glycosyltransferase family 2 protein [Bdellovibrionota bacterium]